MNKHFIALLFVLLFAAPVLNAQVSLTGQSSSAIQWKTIENDFVKVIYPDYLKNRAVYIANLIEHYSSSVGVTFGIKTPKKITLILRAETSDPNGFVTLAPRRTEWYTSTTYSPFVGSLEWYQILSIHEYRHVIQNDVFDKGAVKFLDYLFGDLGISLAGALSKRPWQAEGDAVWAETLYTDAGRGRSPRFLARLKGILLGADTPTYDQFVNGTYRDRLVNQYVYGFILISNGYKKFGDDFWKKVSDKTANAPHPFRMMSAFKEISGQDFYEFYNETFSELRKQWSSDEFPELKKTDYAEATDPKAIGDSIYYVKYDLNSYFSIHKKNDKEDIKIKEISYAKELVKVDFSKEKAVFSEFVPDPRYGFKGSSDIVLVDLASGKTEKVTHQQRFFNPHFNQSGNEIIAAEFTKDDNWQLTVLGLDGTKKQEIILPNLKLTEGAFLNDQTIVAVANDLLGLKSLIKVDLKTKKFEVLIPASRNTLNSVKTDGNENAIFEAQYKGANEVFVINANKKSLAKCTKSRIGAYSPSFAGVDFVYEEETPYGTRLQKRSLNECSTLPLGEIVDYKYLGNNASDNYQGVKVVDFKDQAEMYSKNSDKYVDQDYGSFDARGFTPHSWNFFAGRGIGLQVSTDNYLRDFGALIKVGSDAEENTPYTQIDIDFKKYYVIGSLVGDMRKRETESFGSNDVTDWKESSYGLRLLAPYTFKDHLYSGTASLSVQGEKLSTSDYQLNNVDRANSSGEYFKSSVQATFSYTKDLKFRSIISPWGVALGVGYDSADALNSQSVDTTRVYGDAVFNAAGFAENDGFQFEFSGEEYGNYPQGTYRFNPPILNPLGYIYSRGYQYKSSERFVKSSANYLFPVAYPDFNIGAVWYLKRNYANLYFDHTKVDQGSLSQNLNSYGAELVFQSVFFRFLPVDFGARYIRKVAEEKSEFEMYTTTTIGF